MLERTRRILAFTLLVGLMTTVHASDGGHLVLDLDTLQARLDQTTLHATEVPGAYVGPVDEELFLAVVVDDASGPDEARTVRGYVCNHEVGVWLHGEVDGDEVTLSSDDGVIEIEGTIASGGVFGVARLGEAESKPFAATAATGDAGLYRAQATLDGVDRTAGWVVLEDGRQRGSLDGKGNDVPPPPPPALN